MKTTITKTTLTTIIILAMVTILSTSVLSSFGANDGSGVGSSSEESSSSSTTSSSGGGGGGGAAADTSSVNLLPASQTFAVKKGSSLSFAIGGKSHSLKIQAIIGSKITVRFSSTPFDVVFNSGETKDIDIDKDGQNDLEVKVTKLSGSQASVTVRELIFASCTDGIRNQGEELTDCGGPCDPCIVPDVESSEPESAEAEEAPRDEAPDEQESAPAVQAKPIVKKKKSPVLAAILVVAFSLVAAHVVITRRWSKKP